MDELILKIPIYLELAAQYLGALSVVASVVVRLTPSKSDNELVKKVSDAIFSAVAYLPTVGVNPKTKQLEKAYRELSK